MKRNVLFAIIAVLIVSVGVFAYLRLRPGARAQAQQDPALQVATALTALERSEDHQLTTDQIKTVLPLLRVLRDTDPNDTEASRALAAEIRKVLTPEQVAALEQLRQEAQARRDQGGGQGPQGRRPGPGGSGFGPGQPGTQDRAAFRAQARRFLFARLIRRLENRL